MESESNDTKDQLQEPDATQQTQFDITGINRCSCGRTTLCCRTCIYCYDSLEAGKLKDNTYGLSVDMCDSAIRGAV